MGYSALHADAGMFDEIDVWFEFGSHAEQPLYDAASPLAAPKSA
jgi:hypothetical protein